MGPYRGFTKGFDNADVLTVAPPPRVALVPNAIAFRDSRHGIMGTGWQSCASTGFGCKPQGTISLTTDGGRTWTVLLRTPRPVVAVSVGLGSFAWGLAVPTGADGIVWFTAQYAWLALVPALTPSVLLARRALPLLA